MCAFWLTSLSSYSSYLLRCASVSIKPVSYIGVLHLFCSQVEDLLSSYLKDVGINEEQFVQACGAPSLQSRPQMQVCITLFFHYTTSKESACPWTVEAGGGGAMPPILLIFYIEVLYTDDII